MAKKNYIYIPFWEGTATVGMSDKEVEEYKNSGKDRRNLIILGKIEENKDRFLQEIIPKFTEVEIVEEENG